MKYELGRVPVIISDTLLSPVILLPSILNKSVLIGLGSKIGNLFNSFIKIA